MRGAVLTVRPSPRARLARCRGDGFESRAASAARCEGAQHADDRGKRGTAHGNQASRTAPVPSAIHCHLGRWGGPSLPGTHPGRVFLDDAGADGDEVEERRGGGSGEDVVPGSEPGGLDDRIERRVGRSAKHPRGERPLSAVEKGAPVIAPGAVRPRTVERRQLDGDVRDPARPRGCGGRHEDGLVHDDVVLRRHREQLRQHAPLWLSDALHDDRELRARRLRTRWWR
jgi:hypothetical protein